MKKAGVALEDVGEGEWITINGAHVHLNSDGVVDHGPSDFVGQHLSDIGKGEPGSRTNPIDCHADIEKAAQLISEGKHVSLNQPEQVSTLIDKIRADIAEAKANGTTPPIFNLADISVKGTNLFAQDNLEIPRVQMPQLAGTVDEGSRAAALLPPGAPANAEIDLTSTFLNGLAANGIEFTDVKVRPDYLRATQNELDGAKVIAIADRMNAGTLPTAPIVITKDNYVLDGHHRWAAEVVRTLGKEQHDIPAHRINIDIGRALTLARDFQKEWGLSQQGMTGRIGKVTRYVIGNHNKIVEVDEFLRSEGNQMNLMAEKLAAALAKSGLSLKAVGTKKTGFTSGVEGPFHCGHCIHFDPQGFCGQKDVIADPQAPHNDQGQVVVSPADCCNLYDPANETEKSMTTKAKITGFKKFVPFAKVDEKLRQVWGIVTAEVPDKENEICDYAKSKPYYKAVIDEMSKATDGKNFFPLREMHQLSAVGKGVGFEFRDDEREIFMGFEVVDDDAWKKVQKGVYTGFSQGGSIVGDLTPDPVHKECMRYTANPSECSLVDNPCLGVAHFAYIKANNQVEMRKLRSSPITKSDPSPAVEDFLEELDIDWDDLSESEQKDLEELVAGGGTLSDVKDLLGKAGKMKTATVSPEKRKAARLALVKAFVRKRARIWVNKNSSKVKGRNILLKIDDELGRLAKGMGEVSCLAEMLERLSYVFFMVCNEQEWEQDDDSKLPDMLATNLGSLVDSLLAMVAEEAEELKEDVAERAAEAKLEATAR